MAQSDLMLIEATPEDFLRHLPATDAVLMRKRFLLALAVVMLGSLSLLFHALMPLDWNVAATRAIQTLDLPGLHKLMLVISGFGNAPKLVAVAMVALLACNKRGEAIWLAFSGLGGWFASMGLKQLFANPRPTAELVNVFHQWPNGSFPSGHLVFYITFFGFIFFIARDQMTHGSLLRRGVMLLAVSLIVSVGFSRVFLGEHWISDLPGSYLLGALWLALSVKLYRGWKRARRRPHDWYLPYRVTGK